MNSTINVSNDEFFIYWFTVVGVQTDVVALAYWYLLAWVDGNGDCVQYKLSTGTVPRTSWDSFIFQKMIKLLLYERRELDEMQ